MARIARIVIPGLPHHVTQRGNRAAPVFFEDGDQLRYLAFLKAGAEKSQTAIWAYCLMPNHVHIIAVPSHADGLRALLADAHRKYTNFINWRHKWTGHLWQGRFGSVAMDENHLAEAVRYVSLNPVRAGLVNSAEEWPFSSVRAHLSGVSDGIVDVAPALDRFPDFAAMLSTGGAANEFASLRQSETTGRPLGSKQWLEKLEGELGRSVQRQKTGRKLGDSLLNSLLHR
jgi:putative transposase